MGEAFFADYGWDLDWRFGMEQRDIHIIDSFPNHGKIDNLKAITLLFLHANTTLVLQPIRQEIIERTTNLNCRSFEQHILITCDCGRD